MAGSLNKIMLIGNVGADPEIRRTGNGSAIANIRLATSETWRDKQTGEKREKTEWHSVVVFNDSLVKVVEQYVKKGAKLYVEGQMQTRKWTDKDGNERYSTEVVLQGFGGQITLLDAPTRKADDAPTRPARKAEQPVTTQGRSFAPQPSSFDDEIPF